MRVWMAEGWTSPIWGSHSERSDLGKSLDQRGSSDWTISGLPPVGDLYSVTPANKCPTLGGSLLTSGVHGIKLGGLRLLTSHVSVCPPSPACTTSAWGNFSLICRGSKLSLPVVSEYFCLKLRSIAF